MKILSLSNCPLEPMQGSGKAVLRYVKGLRDLGHEVEVIEPRDFEIWPGLNKAKQHRMAIGAWRVVRQKLQQENYEIIEFYGAEFWLVARKLSKLPERPLLIAHTHGLELLNMEKQHVYEPPASFINYVSRKIYASLFRIYFKCTDALVCLSKPDWDYALEHGFYLKDRVAMVPHGIDEVYRTMPFIAEKEQRVAYFGTWTKRKGIKYLSTVMARILNKIPDLYLDLYGTYAEKEKILADFPGQLHSRIIIYPQLPDQEIINYLVKAKVFFFPSQYDGFGFAIAEAMACSLAAVTTPTGFGAELRDKQEALLCDFEDTEAMEQSVLSLLQDNNLRLKIARGGWEKACSLNWDANVRKLADIYSNWLVDYRKNVIK